MLAYIHKWLAKSIKLAKLLLRTLQEEGRITKKCTVLIFRSYPFLALVSIRLQQCFLALFFDKYSEELKLSVLPFHLSLLSITDLPLALDCETASRNFSLSALHNKISRSLSGYICTFSVCVCALCFRHIVQTICLYLRNQSINWNAGKKLWEVKYRTRRSSQCC